MNIDEFRALKAAEAETQTEQTQTQETPVIESVEVTPVATEVEVPSSKLVVDGVEVSADEIKEWKAGYSRTQDYTRKTQEVANMRKEAQEAINFYQHVKQNPTALNQEALQQTKLDPASQKIAELETKMFDMMVQNEVMGLQNKYTDFNVEAALNIATAKNINLEDAYLIDKASRTDNTSPVATNTQLDIEDIKKQVREQLIAEMQTTNTATSSIISTGDTGAVVASNDGVDKLTSAELDYCKRSKTDPKEYAKWKHYKR